MVRVIDIYQTLTMTFRKTFRPVKSARARGHKNAPETGFFKVEQNALLAVYSSSSRRAILSVEPLHYCSAMILRGASERGRRWGVCLAMNFWRFYHYFSLGEVDIFIPFKRYEFFTQNCDIFMFINTDIKLHV